MKKAVIVSVARTPIAKVRGDFAGITVDKLGAIALKAAVEKAGIDPASIDDVIFGSLFGVDFGNVGRHSVLQAGFPISVPAITVDRQCASSLSALAMGASMIATDLADIVLTGGVESYSQMPFIIKRPEAAFPPALEFLPYKSSTPGGIGDNIAMIPTAENIAKQYGISREESDEFALASHLNAAKAWDSGWFDEQVVPVTIPQRKGPDKIVDRDACVRPDTTMEAMSRLKPVMGEGHIVTAGNASPMNDGASAILLMSEDKAKELGLEALAVVRESAAAGCDPTIMGMGPVYSTRKLMQRFGYKLDDFDFIEINEAFAAQSLACIKELGMDKSRVNVEGGAIAIGHPNGASGGVVAGRMTYVLRHRHAKLGLVTFCVGGGQGFSLVLENPNA